MRCLATLALVIGVAHADDDTSGIVIRTPERWEQRGPLLNNAARPPPNIKGIGVAETGDGRIIERGNARLGLRGSWWTTEQATLHVPGIHSDVAARGWETGLELSYELGSLRFAAGVTQGFVDSAYARGAYRDLGISISKNFQLSRWMKAWISLSLTRRQWLAEKPPDGESSGMTLMLSVGTTFR